MWEDLLPRDAKTSPKQDKLLLILTVSLRRAASLSVPVRSRRSEPARSTSRKPPHITVPSQCLPLMSIMNNTWLREETSFMPVQAVMRVFAERSKSERKYRIPSANVSVGNCSLFNPVTVTRPPVLEIFNFSLSLFWDASLLRRSRSSSL